MKLLLEAMRHERLGRLVAAVARIVAGAVGATIVQALFFLVFGPLSDQSVRQIVNGPKVPVVASLVDWSPRAWIAAAARRRSRLEAQETARQVHPHAGMQELLDRD